MSQFSHVLYFCILSAFEFSKSYFHRSSLNLRFLLLFLMNQVTERFCDQCESILFIKELTIKTLTLQQMQAGEWCCISSPAGISLQDCDLNETKCELNSPLVYFVRRVEGRDDTFYKTASPYLWYCVIWINWGLFLELFNLSGCWSCKPLVTGVTPWKSVRLLR